MAAGVTSGETMETKLIDYSEDPLKGISIFGRHTSSEVFFPFSGELTEVIALLLSLMGPSNAIIDLPEVPPSDVPHLTLISHHFMARNTGPAPTVGSSRFSSLQPSATSHYPSQSHQGVSPPLLTPIISTSAPVPPSSCYTNVPHLPDAFLAGPYRTPPSPNHNHANPNFDGAQGCAKATKPRSRKRLRLKCIKPKVQEVFID